MSAEANDSASSAQDVFVYMGPGSVVPRGVTRVRLHPSVRVIYFLAFEGCYKLVEVELSEGLEEIGDYAFCGCKSLKRITIPSSIRRICQNTFKGCRELVEVELCEGLEVIGDKAFCGCKSLKRITIPSSVRVIGRRVFAVCTVLVTVELHEGLQQIGFQAFIRCRSLRNIAIPPTCGVGQGVFDSASTLEEALPSGGSSAISEALKHRFDGLPIHKLCYYKQYLPPTNMLQYLKEAMGPPDQPNITGTQQDCLGMTPLHILACSTKHDTGLYRSLIEKYPNNLVTDDEWGDIPILYAFWGNVPRGVVQLLVESHKSLFPGHALDWGSMVVTLGEANAPDGIQDLFHTHQNHFSDQDINWEECAVELAKSQIASIGTFHFLLRLSIANRLEALGVEKWRVEVENFINEYPVHAREERARLLYSNLATCEQLKEAPWLLELALWKAKIDDSISNIPVLSDEERYRCRINCGVEQILPIVVSFLSPTWESNL